MTKSALMSLMPGNKSRFESLGICRGEPGITLTRSGRYYLVKPSGDFVMRLKVLLTIDTEHPALGLPNTESLCIEPEISNLRSKQERRE